MIQVNIKKIPWATLRTFFIYLICLSLPVMLVSFTFFFSALDRELYESDVRSRAERVAGLVTERLDSIYASTSGLFNTQWFTHITTNARIYDAEFNIVKRQGISRQLAHIATGMQLVQDVIVVLPGRDTVISSLGWYDMSQYAAITGLADIAVDTTTGRAVVLAKDTERCTALSWYYIRESGNVSTVSVLLLRENVAAYIDSIEHELAPYLRINCGDQVLYKHGNAAQPERFTLTSGTITPIQITVGYDPYAGTLLRDTLSQYMRLLMITGLILLVLAGLLTLLKNIPLHKLIKRRRIPDQGGNVYERIDAYMEEIDQENRQLREENETYGQSIRRMRTLVPDWLIYAILSDPNFDFNADEVEEYLPWIHEELPFLMVLEDTEESEVFTSAQLSVLLGSAKYLEIYRLLENEKVALLWYANMEEAREKAVQLEERLTKARLQGQRIAASPLTVDIRDLRESYLYLKRKLTESETSSDALPVMWQFDFITKLRTNKTDACLALLRNAREQYRPEAFLVLLQRLAKEYGLAQERYMLTYGKRTDKELWSLASNMTCALCRELETLRRHDSSESALQIRTYIDTHYTDPDLSVKKLSDEFGLSGTLISKIFKMHYDITYTDYVLELRMRMAFSLLSETEKNLNEISEAVGYLNYYSFKRAFFRYQGITPREYRALHGTDNQLYTTGSQTHDYD